jgi:HEAT repeat protein
VTRHLLRLVLCLLLLAPPGSGCSDQEPLERLMAELDDPATRVRAIDGLLVQVRQAPEHRRAAVKKRVVHALCAAYRKDAHRDQLVAALALLKDRRGEEVFVAALKDAGRGGAYFEAAVRSARLIGELNLHQRVPELVDALRAAHRAPRKDRNTWLERSLIRSLERLGDRRAVPTLLAILETDPVKQDFYLNRMAARALGRLGDRRAVAPLIETLEAESHGLLLFEANRRALCRIGPAALEPLVKAAGERDRQGRAHPRAVAALRVIGDLGGHRLATERLLGLVKPTDSDRLRLALAETLLRLGRAEGARLARAVLDRTAASVTTRRQAAEVLGWWGGAEHLPHELLATHCAAPAAGGTRGKAGQARAAKDVLCWAVALAYARVAPGAEGLKHFDGALARHREPTPRRHLETYRSRLAMAAACGEDAGCLVKELAGKSPDWRRRERAALDLGRRGRPEDAKLLARRVAAAHPQVKQALLIALERLERSGRVAAAARKAVAAALLAQAAGEVHAAVEAAATNERGDTGTPPAITSQVQCLGARFKRRREEKP